MQGLGQTKLGAGVIGVGRQGPPVAFYGYFQVSVKVGLSGVGIVAHGSFADALQFSFGVLQGVFFADPASQQFDDEFVATALFRLLQPAPIHQHVWGAGQLDTQQLYSMAAQGLTDAFFGSYAVLVGDTGHRREDEPFGDGQPVPEPGQSRPTAFDGIINDGINVVYCYSGFVQTIEIINQLETHQLGQVGMAGGDGEDLLDGIVVVFYYAQHGFSDEPPGVFFGEERDRLGPGLFERGQKLGGQFFQTASDHKDIDQFLFIE